MDVMELSPNTELICNLCGEKIGSVCMMSPDWSAQFSFINATRYHFENTCPKIKMDKQKPIVHQHDMKPTNAEHTQFYCHLCSRFFDVDGKEVQVTFY